MRPVWIKRLAGASVAGLVLVAGACAGNNRQTSGEAAVPAIAPAAAPSGGGATADQASGAPGNEASFLVDAVGAPVTQPGSFISTATVTVAVDDVAAVKPRVLAIAQDVGGALHNEESTFGSRSRSTITLKVPPASFNETLGRLAEVGEVVSQQVKTDDVTQQVIDLDARIAAAAASLDRVRGLLGEARDIDDIVSLEREVTRRQADLESLRGQQQTLQKRIALATIEVVLDGGPVERPRDEPPGFLDGLREGWDLARDLAILTSAVAGALVPFLPVIVLLVLGVRWLARRARRRAAARPARGPGGHGGYPPPPPPAPAPAPTTPTPSGAGEREEPVAS